MTKLRKIWNSSFFSVFLPLSVLLCVAPLIHIGRFTFTATHSLHTHIKLLFLVCICRLFFVEPEKTKIRADEFSFNIILAQNGCRCVRSFFEKNFSFNRFSRAIKINLLCSDLSGEVICLPLFSLLWFMGFP